MVADTGGQLDAVFPDHGRKLIAVVYADMVGYSRLIGLDDAGTFERLRELRRDLIDPALKRHGGTLVSTGGDSLLVRFDSIIPAMRFAVDVQRGVPDFDRDYGADRRMRFRIGVNVGDVIPDGNNLHGEGVNVAARLQSVCPPGAICVSRVVRDHIGNRLGLGFEQLGPLTLKNIAQPVEAFVLRVDGGAPSATPVAQRRRLQVTLAITAALALAGGGGAAWWLYRGISVPVASAPTAFGSAPADTGTARPRLSLVVLPFDNLDGTAEQNVLADGLTEDLTTALAQKTVFLVAARNSAFAYKGKVVDIKRVGEELGVRYAVEGSVRKVGAAMRVNVQLVSTETGVHLWVYQADVDTAAAGPSQDDFIGRILIELSRQIWDIEGARSARERPGNPDATDLLLQAYALQTRPWTQQEEPQAIALYERALQLDPSSADAPAWLAGTLLDTIALFDDPAVPALLDRVEASVAKAELLRPGDFAVQYAKGGLLMWQRRLPESIVAFQDMIESRPNNSQGYYVLSEPLLLAGRAEEAILKMQSALRLDPHHPRIWARYRRMGQASLFLGQVDEAVAWEQRALATSPTGKEMFRALRYVELAAAQAFARRAEEARAAAAEASRLWPTLTVRCWGWEWGPIRNPVFAAQIARVEAGLRLAGVRDHADEDADYGVASDGALHMRDAARTPAMVPGARILRTADLVTFLEQRKPLVLDVNGWGKSVPGAIALPGAGIGGTTTDAVQARLGRKMEALTRGDRTKPIVTMAWNAERFSARNLALRLVALGYANVTWYRGGREAWEVAGQPETEVAVQDW
jgi:TolB-like protein/class 3 adenylate cyclase